MLDGILGRGFSSKCKSLIKQTRTRIDVLRKRKEATQRFLKGNLAQLLSNGLDINAFGRTEEYLAGLDLLFCYDFIEQSCEFILKHLSAMQKIRDCPEDCREAVGSLMFAAARFSDLPELRDLRDALQERYGGSLEHFVSQKFVEKLALREPPTDKKVQLLQNIASEFSIKWDARGFEQRMNNPSAFAQDQPKKYGINPDTDSKYKSPIGKETDPKTEKKNSSREKPEPTVDKHRVHGVGRDNLLKKDELNHNFAEHLTPNTRKPDMGSQQSTPRSDKYGIPLPGRKQLADHKPEPQFANEKEDKSLRRVRSPGGSSSGKSPDVNGHGVHDESVNGIPFRAGWVPVSDGKSEDAARGRGTPFNNYAQPNTANSAKKVQEEEIERTKPYTNGLPPPYTKSKDKLLPPPYIKSKDSRNGVNEEAKKLSSDHNEAPMDQRKHRGDHEVRREERLTEESDHSNYREHGARHARTSSRDGNRDLSNGDEVSLPKPRASTDPTRQKRESDNLSFDDDSSFPGKIPLPKPRSIRKKHSKSSSSRDRDEFASFEDEAVRKRSSSSRRRENPRKGLQILFDDEHRPKDEEEMVIDRLLMHYSKKPTNFDPEKLKRKSKPRADAGEVPQSSRDAPVIVQVEPDVSHPPRSVSLPRGQVVPPEPVKVFTRANSFQPDNPARHVHPKLPDYDDLAARFAALRGR